MSEEHYLAHRHSCLVDYIDNAQRRVLRRSRPLGDRNFSGPFVVNEKVGEGSTDIDRKPVHRSHPPIRRGQDEPTKGATEMQTDTANPGHCQSKYLRFSVLSPVSEEAHFNQRRGKSVFKISVIFVAQ